MQKMVKTKVSHIVSWVRASIVESRGIDRMTVGKRRKTSTNIRVISKQKANIKNSEQGNVMVNENLEGVKLLLTCLDLSCKAFDDCLVDCNVVLCDKDEEGPWKVCFDNGDDVVDCLCTNKKVMNRTKICNETFCEKEDQLIFSHENPEVCDDDVRGEMNLANLSFPRRTMLLSDPNIWLADTTAIVHTTPHHIGLIATKRGHSGEWNLSCCISCWGHFGHYV